MSESPAASRNSSMPREMPFRIWMVQNVTPHTLAQRKIGRRARRGRATEARMRKSMMAVVIVSTLAGAWIATGWTQTSGAKTPIKIGVMYPFKGPFAVLGELQLAGMRLAFDQRGNRIG